MQAPIQVKSNDEKQPNELGLFIRKYVKRKRNVGSTPQGQACDRKLVSCSSGCQSPLLTYIEHSYTAIKSCHYYFNHSIPYTLY